MKTLLTNARVWLNKNNFVRSVGFDSSTGKITHISDSESKDKFDEVIDVKGKLVLPAFTEGHCHFVEGSYLNSLLNLREAKTKKDFIVGIRKYISEKGSSRWVQGGFFSEANFEENIELGAEFLDGIAGDVPIVISRFDSHSAFANSKALELSGILDSHESFSADELMKDSAGKLTGELKESVRKFVLNQIPPSTLNERTEIALKQQDEFLSFGISAISDITLYDDLEVYREMISRGKLFLNVDARLPFREYKNLKKYSEEFSKISDKIKFNSLKAFYDGSLSSMTGLMHKNYKGTDKAGIKTDFVNSGEFEKLFFDIDRAGYQMSVHAIGDKAVTELLDMNELLIKMNGNRDRRFRMEHAQHIQPDDFKRFKDLGVIASVQPSHLFSDAQTAKKVLDEYELEHNYRKLFDIGVSVCFGTDFPIVSENPFETIYYAMTRKVIGFESGFMTENKIPLDKCLEAYTINNAFASYDDKMRGSLEIGKAADLIVLETDLFEANEGEIRNCKVERMYVSGKEGKEL